MISTYPNIQAPVFAISRHRLSIDGPGVTTLVTLQGCTLHCKYCPNPECFKPAESFPFYTPQSLYNEVKKDDIYFRATGGGITFGGGEPALKADFIEEFCKICPDEWNICLETALSVPQNLINRLIPVINEWIVDLKILYPKEFRQYTGHDSTLRDLNLDMLINNVPADNICIRIPVIPGFNTPQDAENTKKTLAAMGFIRFDIFNYVIGYVKEANANFQSLIPGLKYGKAKCEILKRVRSIIAEANNIKPNESECTHTGDCMGTCPLCEAELKELTNLIYRKIKNNQSICL